MNYMLHLKYITHLDLHLHFEDNYTIFSEISSWNWFENRYFFLTLIIKALLCTVNTKMTD